MAGVPIPSTRGSSSRLLSSADVRCLTPLGPLTPRSHPLTFLYMFRTNVLDLTRDNRASIPDLSFLSSCFRLPGPIFFVIVNRRSQPMLLLLVDTHSRLIRPTARLSVCLMPSSHTPKVVRLFHFLASLSSPRLICDMLWSSPRPSLSSLLAARCMNRSSALNYQIKFLLFCHGELVAAVHSSTHPSSSSWLLRRSLKSMSLWIVL